MKQIVIVLLSLGLVGALANTLQTDNNNTTLPEPSDSVAKHNEDTNKSEQKGPDVSFVDTGLGTRNDEFSITIEEDVISPDFVPAQNPEVFITDIPEFPVEENNLYKTLYEGYEDQNEIMDVAASWSPPPFFRRQKQKARRRFFAPRHFIQNPYRRFHYNPYHAFYRPRPYFF